MNPQSRPSAASAEKSREKFKAIPLTGEEMAQISGGVSDQQLTRIIPNMPGGPGSPLPPPPDLALLH